MIRLPPSSAHIWAAPLGCPGWAHMVKDLPKNDENQTRKEGITAHKLAEICFSRGDSNIADSYLYEELLGVLVSEEMIRHVKEYVDKIMAMASTCDQAGLEEEIEYSIHTLGS